MLNKHNGTGISFKSSISSELSVSSSLSEFVKSTNF